LAGILDVITVPAGAALTHEGTLAREFIVVADGDADVERGGTQIATIGPGEILGEMAFFGDGRRTATVRARTPMRLLVGNPRSFQSMLTNPTLAERVRAVVEARSGAVREA
jgi:CRP-like cAMP-binding protein